MIKLKIDKGIPIPEKHGGLAVVFRALKIGDSFLYPKAKRAAFASYQSRFSIKICTRNDPDNPEMVRIWRIK